MKPDFEKYDIAGQSKKDFLRLLHVYQQAIDRNIICSITDSEGVIIYVNRKFCEISKYSKDELVGQDHRILNSGFHARVFLKICGAQLKVVIFGMVKLKTKQKTVHTFG